MSKQKDCKIIIKNKFINDSKDEREFKIADIIARIINSKNYAC